MTQYNVTGMSCAACSTRVEKAVSAVDGVSNCAVNLLTNSMTVEGTADSFAIIKAVEDAGYSATVKGGSDKSERTTDNTSDKGDFSVFKKRLLTSMIFLIGLMYVSMGHTMFAFPLPVYFKDNPVALGMVQMILASIVIIINGKFFVNGFKGFVKKSPNMDTLVALGSGASFVYSVWSVFVISDAAVAGDMALSFSYLHNLYFESAAMILVLITFGKMLEARSKGKTTSAIKSLMDLSPKTATVVVDGSETEIDASMIKKGDIFIVKPGASIPADGIVAEGHCAVDESALTGESIPVDKGVGDTVSAATVNRSGFIKCEAVKVGEETMLSQIIKMVTDASATKAPIAKVADKVSGVFVPVVMAIAAITMLVWLVCGASFGYALTRGISVLVISCPCALGLATPVAIMVGNGVGAKNGILFKNAAVLEHTGKTEIVAVDKTGTITKGEPRVTDVIPAEGTDKTQLMKLAYSLEAKSEHPIAKAIVSKSLEDDILLLESGDFEVFPGNGLSATVEGEHIFGGNKDFVSGYIESFDGMTDIADKLATEGKTPVYFGKGGTFAGIIAVADSVKDDSAESIQNLKDMGIKVVMLTGDNKKTANAVKEKTGIDKVIAEVTPAGKEEAVRMLKTQGRVAMVGDGINDAPALTAADVGMAVGGGTDVAIDAADIVLMKSSLADVVTAIRLSRATLKNIRQNLFWAFIYNIIGIPLAAGVWIPMWGLELSPMFGAAAMSLSSVCVVTNALRLNFFKSSKQMNKIKQKSEEKTMEKTIKIEGMMCPHCSGRVKTSLEQIDGVAEAVVSHENGTAIVKLTKEVSVDLLKSAVEEQGYKVLNY